MKKSIGILFLSALVLGACVKDPLRVYAGKTTQTATQTMTRSSVDTKTDTSSATATQTAPTTDTGTGSGTDTATTVVTATRTETATATSTDQGSVFVDFTDAFHSEGLFNVKPGAKSVIFGTFMFTNMTGKPVEMQENQIMFYASFDPRSNSIWTDTAQSTGTLIPDHIANCVLRSWPDLQVYAGPVSPGELMTDAFTLEPFTGSNALALDFVCDFTGLQVQSEIGFSVEYVAEPSPKARYVDNGNPVTVGYRTPNSIPGPGQKVAAILTPVPTFEFCAVGDSAVSQGCCAKNGAVFPRATLPLTGGMLIRDDSFSMVYYYASNGKRYDFPNKDVLVSWYASGDDLLTDTSSICDNVSQISDADMAAIMIGGNVDIRPGTYIIKIASDPKLYAVSRGQVIRWLATNDLAEQIYPGTSIQRLRIVPDAFFVNYKVGLEVNSASDYDPVAEYDWGAPNTMEAELGIIK